MIAEILSTGEEIRCGIVIDTNAAHIAQCLESSGVTVSRHQSVGDGLDDIRDALVEIASRADLAVVTGGLGPTVDDRTAEAAALAAGVTCRPDPEALSSMNAFFAAQGRTISDCNRKQALLPQGSTCLANPVGTAPGFCLALGKCLLYFLPGVPREMRRMMESAVLPDLEKRRGGEQFFHRKKTLVTFGLPESVTGQRLEGFEAVFPRLTLGLQVRFPEIIVRVSGKDPVKKRLEDQLSEAEAWVCDRLGEKVVSTTGASLAEVVGAQLKNQGATVALAESCTGGLIAHKITEVPGSSDYFLFSGVVYANEAKTAVLGVPQEILDRHGAVSEETARAMAQGAKRLANATWGLATTGIAGPGGGSDEKPVGTVCIGLDGPDGCQTFRYQFAFHDRDLHKRIFAWAALNCLRRALFPG